PTAVVAGCQVTQIDIGRCTRAVIDGDADLCRTSSDYRRLIVAHDYSLHASRRVATGIAHGPGHQIGAHWEACRSVAGYRHRPTAVVAGRQVTQIDIGRGARAVIDGDAHLCWTTGDYRRLVVCH